MARTTSTVCQDRPAHSNGNQGAVDCAGAGDRRACCGMGQHDPAHPYATPDRRTLRGSRDLARFPRRLLRLTSRVYWTQSSSLWNRLPNLGRCRRALSRTTASTSTVFYIANSASLREPAPHRIASVSLCHVPRAPNLAFVVRRGISGPADVAEELGPRTTPGRGGCRGHADLRGDAARGGELASGRGEVELACLRRFV